MRLTHRQGLMALLASLLILVTGYSYALPSDSQIYKQVKNEFDESDSQSADSIHISVIQGVVKLSGQLDSEDEVTEAVESIQSMPGVKDVVVNDLHVNGSNKPLTDAIITAKVKGVLIQNQVFGDKDLEDVDISIETHHGIVSITGLVDSPLDMNNIIPLVSAISGVISVRIHLQLSASHFNPGHRV